MITIEVKKLVAKLANVELENEQLRADRKKLRRERDAARRWGMKLIQMILDQWPHWKFRSKQPASPSISEGRPAPNGPEDSAGTSDSRTLQ